MKRGKGWERTREDVKGRMWIGEAREGEKVRGRKTERKKAERKGVEL